MSRWKEELPSYEEPDEGVANLKRHGIKVGYIDMQNSVCETLVPTKLVVRDCFVDVDDDLAAGIALDANANRGQFIALAALITRTSTSPSRTAICRRRAAPRR